MGCKIATHIDERTIVFSLAQPWQRQAEDPKFFVPVPSAHERSERYNAIERPGPGGRNLCTLYARIIALNVWRLGIVVKRVP